MNRNILDELYSDPDFYSRMVAKAHRERSRAIAASFAWLLRQAKARFAPGLLPTKWIARLG